jgi:hypothetical protein
MIEPRLTAGCRFDYLEDHLRLASSFVGIIIGVDGAGYRRAPKIEKLRRRCPVPSRCLWAIAEPSIEEWMMADGEALPEALSELFGTIRIQSARRPGRAHAERTAKARLREWTEALLGEPVLQGGVEYAMEVAKRVNPARVSQKRNRDLRQFMETVPEFLADCISAGSP